MRAVISVIGKDMVGILAKVTAYCADANANVVDVTQTILQDMFVMVMIVEISKLTCPFATLSDELTGLGQELGLDVRVMHENIFNSMHRI